MSEIILFVASSLDGFIADKNGNVSWLDHYQIKNQDYGYSEFLQGIDIIVMGSKTFEQLLTFGPWPYGDTKTYVLTKRKLQAPEGAQVLLYSGDLAKFLPSIKKESKKAVWLVGGAAVVQSFIRLKAIDSIILSIMPVLLGEGISLFGETGAEVQLNLMSLKTYHNGVVQLHYSIR